MKFNVSTSFVQDQRHVTKSERFVPIQPSQISEVLADHGLRLNHLKSSRARLEDRAHHQTTIARYVAEDSADMVRIMGDGSTLDLLVRAPHLTGAIELRLGFFRGTCANQWNAGKLLGSVKVRHQGDCLNQLNSAIPALVARRTELAEQILAMGARKVSTSELVQLAGKVADLRLANVENPENVRTGDLIRRRRADDQGEDLFSVANVLQENAIRFGLRYNVNSIDPRSGRTRVRHMETREIVETTGAAVDLSGSIWEEAAKLLG